MDGPRGVWVVRWDQLWLVDNHHSRHHASPNHLGKDPDIESRAVALSAEAADRRRGLGAWFARRQGILFLPLLMLEGLSLHASSIRRVFARRPVKHRAVEITFLAVRILGYLAVVFLLLPPELAAAFVGVQLVVFGLLLGGAFAPNHIAMPIVPGGLSVDFLRRQVLMSRNISGNPVVRFLMGGLDTQVEHHLFSRHAAAQPAPRSKDRPRLLPAARHCVHRNLDLGRVRENPPLPRSGWTPTAGCFRLSDAPAVPGLALKSRSSCRCLVGPATRSHERQTSTRGIGQVLGRDRHVADELLATRRVAD